MREVGTHPEEDITVPLPEPAELYASHTIRTRVSQLCTRRESRTYYSADIAMWVLHSVWHMRDACARIRLRAYTCMRVCACHNSRVIATHGRTHESGSPWNAGFTSSRRGPETNAQFSRTSRFPGRRNRGKNRVNAQNEHALCRAADDSTRDTLGETRVRTCVCARIVDVASLSLERYADDFCSTHRDAPGPDFEARCDLTGNALRVTRDARGSVIEWRSPATTRSEKRALSDLDLPFVRDVTHDCFFSLARVQLIFAILT